MQQSVHNRAGLEQQSTGGEQCGLSLQIIARRLLSGRQIGPIGWNQRLRAVRQHCENVQSAASAAPAEDIERHALVGMPRAQDGYLLRITIEVVVGIMSGLPSTR
jgi:hypothetical protein